MFNHFSLPLLDRIDKPLDMLDNVSRSIAVFGLLWSQEPTQEKWLLQMIWNPKQERRLTR